MAEFAKTEISQVDVLSLPFFYGRGNSGLYETPTYKGLAQAWDNRQEELSKMPGGMLVRVSLLPPEILDLGYTPHFDSALSREQARIKQSKEKLGSRFMVFNGVIPPLRDDFLGQLNYMGLTWNPDEVKILAYGEHQINRWEEMVRSYLEAQSKYTAMNNGLTLGEAQRRQIEAEYREDALWKLVAATPVMFGMTVY